MATFLKCDICGKPINGGSVTSTFNFTFANMNFSLSCDKNSRIGKQAVDVCPSCNVNFTKAVVKALEKACKHNEKDEK